MQLVMCLGCQYLCFVVLFRGDGLYFRISVF